MSETASEDFLVALRAFLAPVEGTQFWDSLWWSHTDIEHFTPFVEMLGRGMDLAGARVLDTGCGSAGLMVALAQAGAAELVGVELDENVARLAELRARSLPSARIITDDAALLDLPASSFDAATSIHVIEHVADPDGYVATMARLLKPAGRLLIACPNRFWPLETHSTFPLASYVPKRLRFGLGSMLEHRRWLSENARAGARNLTLYESDFSSRSLRRLLRRHGFEAVEMNPPALWASGANGAVVRAVDATRKRTPPRAQQAFSDLASRQLQGVFRLAEGRGADGSR